MKPARLMRLVSTAQSNAMTMTQSRPSLLPLVLIFATIGFNNQAQAYFSAFVSSAPRFFSTTSISHPAIISDAAKSALPKLNQYPPGHVVGSKSQASRGV